MIYQELQNSCSRPINYLMRLVLTHKSYAYLIRTDYIILLNGIRIFRLLDTKCILQSGIQGKTRFEYDRLKD